ncbi:MAG: hypothetical protein R6X32_19190, partial [Chloroflexota bacterium]
LSVALFPFTENRPAPMPSPENLPSCNLTTWVTLYEETTRAAAHQPMNKNNATNFTNEHEFVKFV